MTEFLDIAFCFEPETLTGADVVSIFEKTLFFEPSELRTDVFCRGGCKFKRHYLRRIAKDPNVHIIELESDAGMERGPFLYLTEVRAMQCLYLNFSGEKPIPMDVLEELACRRGFRAGYCHSAEDTFWQGAIQTDTYVLRNRPHEHLPKIWDDDLNELTIDISRNPGRRDLISKMWLQAAWRMWYGEEAQKLIPRELLLSFPDAARKSTLPCGTVFLQLFDDPLAGDDPENRRRQQAFRDHMGFDAVIERADNERNPDRHFEHQKGSFANGGTHRFIRWVDAKGRTALRSRAARKEISEFSEDAELLKKWVEPEKHEHEP